MPTITPCLWFDSQAEEAASFYCGIFPNSKVGMATRFGKEAAEASGQAEGSVLTVAFTLDGQEFLGLNGGPMFKFSEAVSFMVHCEDQEEIDYYWQKLSEGGEESMCGWLKDKFGLSWQIVPKRLSEMLEDPDTEKQMRVQSAIMTMRKLDLEALERAFRGEV